MNPPLTQWQGRTAMVVDDSPSMRLECCRILRELGFANILQAENGQHALNQLMQGQLIDFLLTDLNMPVLDGVELLDAVEKSFSGKLYVGVMSGLDSSLLSSVREIASGSELELVAILPKPITADCLYRALKPHDPSHHQFISRQHGTFPPLFSDEFASAMQSGEILAYYQPKISLTNDQIVGVEVLARWQHAKHGLVPPAAFLEHIENGPLALPHFLFQLTTTLEFLKEASTHHPGFCASMNLPVQLLSEHELVEKITSLVERTDVSASQLTFEVTETSIMSNLKACLSTLTRLRIKGFGIAMDDYGTGYSSMKQLAKCPFTELKIDRSFVHAASSDQKLLSILTAAINISQELKLTSVAEGVEDFEDWRLARSLKCEIGQGYYFSRPLTKQDMLAYLIIHSK
jgi:EAL domain-containing protein (putative c-di-GMP-specific phosphodiesterase class I)